MALLLQSEPLLLGCSTRAGSCESATRMVRDEALRCGVKVEFRNHTSGPVVVVADGAFYEVIVQGKATARQRACLAEAVRTVQIRLHSTPSGSKK